MNRDLLKRYRFFREQGFTAKHAIALARAELIAESLGWDFTLEPEYERYEDVYGEPPPKGVEFFCVVARDHDGDCIGSLGFVDDVDGHYFRVVAAELYSEALETTHRPGIAGITCDIPK